MLLRMHVKRPLVFASIAVVFSVVTIGWLMTPPDPRIRQSILLRCASDVASAWAEGGPIDRESLKETLSNTASQSKRYTLRWDVNDVERCSPFARVTIEEGDHVSRVLILDLVDEKAGYVVTPRGYRKLKAEENATARAGGGDANSGFLFFR